MSTASLDSSNAKYRAKFIHNHGQKPSLTMITPSSLIGSLYRLYPLLIITDCALSNLMWICDDLCLPFVYLVTFTLAVNILEPMDSIGDGSLWRQWNFNQVKEYAVNTWFGLTSVMFLFFSFIYYVQSVYHDISHTEQPTLDDIIVVLESVLDKLETVRKEVLMHGLQINGWLSLIKTILIMTPIQLILMKYISVKLYTILSVLVLGLYHSTWFQATFKLFWRILLVRKFYYYFYYIFNKNCISKFPILDLFDLIKHEDLIISLPFTKTLKGLEDNRLKLFIQKLYPQDSSFKGLTKDWQNKNSIKILDVKIQENQRKWHPDGWTSKLVSYERSPYSIEINNKIYSALAPSDMGKLIPEGWQWLDNEWHCTVWSYSNTDWEFTGLNESLEGCTRSKIWSRRLFHL
ncbi:hypothetical protein Kpol_1048p34 [Vanderwaltozyma polyspora DSM 70294]|uniref:Peroxin/Ferlin domain-containing protein n=1 Tax=Vanderwaltozyma polyspora (strain ATCC 22028 / DSM 70294 / BCRC 21397 / CBS 2163 / NBRC 10782 / NRRL Y-8283 / UCD 57-17) TaxID=436907 RepID=A7TGJ6_VANPO|nr:uncharacterized protein Kpol_1048p34 [Vanderwaltozyma polyspora DSM 70294]EDO18603.1 hypothetical protein Kpol_1048p34 [Vanderwaltozyma polyspora DSM 70294]